MCIFDCFAFANFSNKGKVNSVIYFTLNGKVDGISWLLLMEECRSPGICVVYGIFTVLASIKTVLLFVLFCVIVFFKEWGVVYILFKVTYTLSILSEATGKSITEIIEPHKDAIAEMVPPKKHLLRYQPPVAQIGIMVGSDVGNAGRKGVYSSFGLLFISFNFVYSITTKRSDPS